MGIGIIQIAKPEIVFDAQKSCALGIGYGYHTNTHTQYPIHNFLVSYPYPIPNTQIFPGLGIGYEYIPQPGFFCV